MFLVERLSSPIGLRADLAPRQLLGGSGELIRAALVARAPADPAATKGWARPASQLDSTKGWARPASQLDLALPQPTRRRKAG